MSHRELGHNVAQIPGSSLTGGVSSGIFMGGNGTVLVAVLNASTTAQTNYIGIFDAPSVAAVLANPATYPRIYAPYLDAGKILDMTILDKGIRFNYGIVAIPNGAANSDGGWTVLYD